MGQAAAARAQARAEAQRERILEAAQASFVDHGFHAANMAGIAEAAGMSAGLIYRYFASKNEIILAIIQRQLELTRGEIARLHGSADLALDIWKSLFQPASSGNRMQPGLYAEMSAEAGRDEQIGAAVADADRMLRDEVGAWLARDRDGDGMGLTPTRARHVSLLLQCLVDGLRLRQLREPDLDPAFVKRALRELLVSWLR